MKLWFNDAMENALIMAAINLQTDTFDTPPEITPLLQSGFRENHNCILFAQSVCFGPGSPDTDISKIHYEVFLNLVQLWSYIGWSKECSRLKAAIGLGMALKTQLTQAFSEQFRVIINFDGVGEFNKRSGALTFHKIRNSVDKEFVVDYLSLIKNEAILFLE